MSTLDRFAAVWGALLNLFLGRNAVKTVDACALYFGKVVAVNGANVDVQLDTTAIPSPSKVPLYVGLPGTSAACPGARVLVGFRNGDPSQPYAIGFEQASTVQSVTIGQTSPKQAARKGDAVNLGQCYVTVAAGAVATVVINGVALPVGADPGTLNRGTVNGGSGTVSIGD